MIRPAFADLLQLLEACYHRKMEVFHRVSMLVLGLQVKLIMSVSILFGRVCEQQAQRSLLHLG